MDSMNQLWDMLNLHFKSHPWHGIDIGEQAPNVVMSFIEMIPTDTVKYEIDKKSGYLIVDRPQKFSNICPALYGFVPQTLCDEKTAQYCNKKTNRTDIVGDQDPLDILVLTERHITHGNIIVPAIPIGGIRMIDKGEADDKIVAILKGDGVYNKWKDIKDCPSSIIERLCHYFLTYKEMPGNENRHVEIADVYGRQEALDVIGYAREDYKKKFGHDQLKSLKKILKNGSK